MSLKAFIFIIASALFHVLWNSFLKKCRDKSVAVFLMMVVTVILFLVSMSLFHPVDIFFDPPIMSAAFVAAFFFFLYQYFVALAYEKGDLTLVYPLTVTGPVYIVIWGFIFLGEKISLTGSFGIILIVYGAVTIQSGRLIPDFHSGGKPKPGMISLGGSGATLALAAAFFYSFGALADKIGVMKGNITLYTLHLCIYMMFFHLARLIFQQRLKICPSEFKIHPLAVTAGGTVMFLSFITFRIGLEESLASYASALRQVSTLFGILIGFFIFRESITLNRFISSFIIVTGAVLIKLG